MSSLHNSLIRIVEKSSSNQGYILYVARIMNIQEGLIEKVLDKKKEASVKYSRMEEGEMVRRC